MTMKCLPRFLLRLVLRMGTGVLVHLALVALHVDTNRLIAIGACVVSYAASALP
jgi:hypothetical protein